jgi:hypothetical protein
MNFREIFGRSMYEALNKEKFKKVKDEDYRYLVDAYNDDIIMGDAEEEEEVSEDEDDENHSYSSKGARVSNDAGENSLLAVGYKSHRSFVVRGDKIGVFSNDDRDGDLKLSATINAIKTPQGKLFSPAKMMLHQQDSSMILQNPDTPGSLYKMDLETEKIVEHWEVDSDRHIVDFTPDSKYAQLTPQQTFVGISSNAIFKIDPRQPGKKLVESQLNQYKSKNQFGAAATTGKGELVVASDKGDLRLYNQIEKRAKTHLPGLGGIS